LVGRPRQVFIKLGIVGALNREGYNKKKKKKEKKNKKEETKTKPNKEKKM